MDFELNNSCESKLKIATLNLNGETWYSINRKPRLPRSLYDINKIKNDLTQLTVKGLGEILKTKEYDIIAVQELVYSKNEITQIEAEISNHGYTLLKPDPKSLSCNTHFVAGFIVKTKPFSTNVIHSIEGLKPNKYICMNCQYAEKEFDIYNMHITEGHDQVIEKIVESKKDNNNIIIGDMNACLSSQAKDKNGTNHDEFFGKISEAGYIEDQNCNSNYTWYSSSVKRKLDHIFLSQGFRNLLSKDANETKEDSVNFYCDEMNGFTDHSMLVLEIDFKLKE